MTTASLPNKIILYDGDCAVCDAWVQWVLDRDLDARFHFAALQGETAATIKAAHPELPAQLDSLILFSRDGDVSRVDWYTDAVAAMLAELKSPWSWGRAIRLFPRPLRDLCYRAFAASRYAIFGKLDQCRMPRPGEAERFLP